MPAQVLLCRYLCPICVVTGLSQSTATINREIKTLSGRLLPHPKCMLQPFFHQRTQRCTFGPCQLSSLFDEGIWQLYRGFHTGHP